MMENATQRQSGRRLRLVLGIWIVAAQIWYFYQYTPAMGSLLRTLSRRVWR
jgi:hypothetical protein